MIAGTPWSPAIAFFRFAREFIGALAADNIAAALQPLDSSDPRARWSKAKLVQELRRLAGPTASITSPGELRDSARPAMKEISPDLFEVEHRLPVNGKWSHVAVVFSFARARGGFRVTLVGFRVVA